MRAVWMFRVELCRGRSIMRSYGAECPGRNLFSSSGIKMHVYYLLGSTSTNLQPSSDVYFGLTRLKFVNLAPMVVIVCEGEKATGTSYSI